MFKYLFCFLIVFFLRSVEPARSQTAGDSSAVEEISQDSLLIPKEDTGYLPKESTREVSQRQTKSYLKNPDYAYANDPEYWRRQAPQEPGLLNRLLTSAGFRWIFFIGLISFVLYGIYRLVLENNFSWFVRKGIQSHTEATENLADEETDYDAAIRKFQEAGDYRLAVRFMYLRLIQTVRERSGITIHDSSTNAEIGRALGNHPLAGEFRYLSMAYEYIFYGGFLPKQELYDDLKNKFEYFQQNLSV
jgi:hypothetical protein